MKTKIGKKIVHKQKIKDVSKNKKIVSSVIIPTSLTSRVIVLGNYLNSLKLKKGQSKKIDLSSLKINGKSFESLISSRACIGTTTRAGLKESYSFKCEKFITVPKENKKLYVVFTVTKK